MHSLCHSRYLAVLATCHTTCHAMCNCVAQVQSSKNLIIQWRLLHLHCPVLTVYISSISTLSDGHSGRACFKMKIVGGQRCCPIDDCGRPKAAWGVSVGGCLGAPSHQGVRGYNPGKCLIFYIQNSAFWHISDGVFCILDCWIYSAEIYRPTIWLVCLYLGKVYTPNSWAALQYQQTIIARYYSNNKLKQIHLQANEKLFEKSQTE